MKKAAKRIGKPAEQRTPAREPGACSGIEEPAGQRTPAREVPSSFGVRRAPVRLLTGGNPQIAKGDGDAPVRAYLQAIPEGWKRKLGVRLDELIVRSVPGVRKAVKWNSPFYGVDGMGWFVSFHVFTRYIKVTFFRGTSLLPVPPGGSGREARWIDIDEKLAAALDEAQFADWLRQAAALPGWDPSNK